MIIHLIRDPCNNRRKSSILTRTRDGKVPQLSGSSTVLEPVLGFGSVLTWWEDGTGCVYLTKFVVIYLNFNFGRHYEFCLNHAIRFNFFEIWNFLGVKCLPIPSCKNLKRTLWLKKFFISRFEPLCRTEPLRTGYL